MFQRVFATVSILLLISTALACSLLPSKRTFAWHLLLEVDTAAPDRAAAVAQCVNVISQRLDAFAISRFEVIPQATGRILVNLPNVADRERLKNLITTAGKLELTAVVSPPSPAPVQTYATKEEAVAALGGTVPANRRVLPYSERNDSATGPQSWAKRPQLSNWVVVEAPAIVDGSELRDAAARESYAGTDDYQIAFSLRPKGAEKFGAWTGQHINTYIGVVLNDEVKSIAFIRTQIFDQGEITGRFTKQSADDLALVLRSGALPAPVKIVEEGDNK